MPDKLYDAGRLDQRAYYEQNDPPAHFIGPALRRLVQEWQSEWQSGPKCHLMLSLAASPFVPPEERKPRGYGALSR